MRITLLVAAALLVGACGGSSDTTVEVYKSFGSVQCTGGGATLSQLSGQLAGAGIEVMNSACGTDGLIYPAACGNPDGAIGIFAVSENQLAAAEALQFMRLSTLPRAARVMCR